MAISAVLFDHCSRTLGFNQFGPVGRSGVLLFFVHTALVLMFSLERLQSRGRHFVVPFYLQRLFRIYPLCLVCIAVVLVFHIPGQEPYMWRNWGWIWRNILMVQNFTFTPYLSGPLWSLPYELQMYVVLPFVFLAARRKHALLNIAALWLLGAGSAIWLNRFYLQHYGPHYDDSLHSPVTWFVPCFLGGVIAFILAKRKKLSLPFAILPPLLLAFIVGIFYFPIRHTDWYLCTALGIALPQIRELASRSSAAVCHNIAKYSYGVYLSHAPLLWLIFQRGTGLPDVLRWPVFWGLLAIVSVGCYRAIEKPMIDVGRRLARRLEDKAESIDTKKHALVNS